MKKIFIHALSIMAVLCCQAFQASAQSGSITGNITGSGAEALPGATVVIKGTTVGAVSNTDGDFSIRGLADGSYTLQVRYTGYGSKELTVKVPGESVRISLEENSVMDEVIVTGVFDQRTRLESSIAITTLKAKELERITPVSAADLLKNVPGVYVNSSLGEIRNTIYSRGVSVGSNDGASGYYYVSMQEDGLPVTNATFTNFGPDYFLRADLTTGRVEAVRGGTASILGSNAPGGIFNYVSKTGGTEFGGQAAVKLGLEGKNQPYYRADLVLGGPLNKSKDLGYSIGGFYRVANGARYPGYPMNNGGQVKGNLVKQYATGSLKLYAKYLNDKNAWYEFLPTTGFSDPKLPEGVSQTNSVLIPPVQSSFRPNNYDESIDYDSRDKIHSTDRALGLNWEQRFGKGWTFQNNIRYSDKRAVWNTTAVVYPFAVDGIVWHALNGTIANFGTYQISEHGTGKALMTVGQYPNIGPNGEFWGFTFPVISGSLPGSTVQANSLFFNPLLYQNNHLKELLDQFSFSKKLDHMSFTLGGFIGKSKAELQQAFSGITYGTISSPRPTTVDITYTDLGGQTYQLSNPANGVIGGSSAALTENDIDQLQAAIFFGHDWKINSRLNFDWGVRFENFKVSGSNAIGVAGVDTTGGLDKNPLTLYDNTVYMPGNTYRFDKSLQTFSFSGGLNYKISDGTAIYARYSQGAKAPDMGLFTGVDTESEERLLDPQAQKTQQVEFGLKARSGNMNFFVTPFFSILSNVYSQQIGQETNDISTSYSAAPLYNKYQTMGIELETDMEIARGFNLRAVLTLQKAEATKFQAWIFNANGREDDEIQDFSGNKTDNSANTIFSITPSYTHKRLYASINWYFMGKRAANVPNAFELPSYNQFNLSLGYDVTPAFRLSANINNLFNQIGVMGWSAPGGFPAALDRQGFTKEILNANPDAVYSTLSIPPRAYFLTASYKF
ncbi:MAG: TonB-dependent receptor [Saprospiraceae bacterium]|nr:TonB-dependent receptor [Saprospiraceae bacterium]